jgi:hypothetical protein
VKQGIASFTFTIVKASKARLPIPQVPPGDIFHLVFLHVSHPFPAASRNILSADRSDYRMSCPAAIEEGELGQTKPRGGARLSNGTDAGGY